MCGTKQVIQRMALPASVCGIYDCETCEHLAAGLCEGCREGNQRLRETSLTTCAVYDCAQTRGIGSCLECVETACSLRRNVEGICPLRSRFEKQRWWAGRMSRALESRKRRAETADQAGRMPDRVVNRLRWYLTALDTFAADGCESVSSWQLAERVGVSAALIRKDLSRFGGFGTPSYGYKIELLRERIEGILCLDTPRNVAWVGSCAFRHGITAIQRLAEHNCRIVALFDTADDEIGSRVGDLTVLSVESIRETLAGSGICAAVLAVGGPWAHEIAQTLVDLGARAILNLSGELLVLPEHVRVTSVDLAGELLELCYYCQG